MDQMEIYERIEGGPTPAVILDGHSSRLDPLFIQYVNDPTHRWNIWFGVPYATSYWQVGDSSEQNGAFKMGWSKVKKRFVSYLSDRGITPLKISNENVMPLLNQAWDLSFGKVENAKKAIAERGWYPPTRNLLNHPEIRRNENIAEKPCEK